MKDCTTDKYLLVLDRMRNARNKAVRSNHCHYLDGLRYSEDIHNILHFLFLAGSIDYGEFKKLELRYRVRSKDLRKYVYCADLIDDEIRGKKVEIESG